MAGGVGETEREYIETLYFLHKLSANLKLTLKNSLLVKRKKMDTYF